MRFGCCVGQPEQIDVLARAGYDFCELPAHAVLPFEPDAAAAPTLRVLEAAPLRPEAFNVLVPARLPLVGPDADRAALQAYLERAFARMAHLGAVVVVLGSGAARRIPEGMPRDQALEQLAGAFALAGEAAARAGLALALEPLNRQECNVFNTLEESRSFLHERGLSQYKLLADLHHFEMEHESLAQVTAAGPLLAHAHLADAGRRPPGSGGYDMRSFLAALSATGYDRRLSAECAWDDFAAQVPAALAFMRQAWDEARSVQSTIQV